MIHYQDLSDIFKGLRIGDYVETKHQSYKDRDGDTVNGSFSGTINNLSLVSVKNGAWDVRVNLDTSTADFSPDDLVKR